MINIVDTTSSPNKSTNRRPKRKQPTEILDQEQHRSFSNEISEISAATV